MSDRKGVWRRADRVVLGQRTARRASKLGYVGEQLAAAGLSAHGFTNIRPLNHPKKNHPFADIYAERNGERLWISVKTRNKYQTDGSLNYCYKISPKERAFADRFEQDDPGSEAACIGVSIVVSQNSCRDGELPNSYSCYFAKLRALTDRQGMGMRKWQLPQYERFAENEQIPANYDVSDCENIFQRKGSPQPGSIGEERRGDPGMPMTEAEKLKRRVDTLRESIRLDWLDLASKPLTASDRTALRGDIAALGLELRDLIGRFDALL